jgi:thiamine biosynthesis lipoprotein
MLLDLGGIAKGFAVDRALAAMRAAGAEGGLVNAGGDMRAFGEHAFPVDIRGARGHVERRWSLRDQALASSDNAASRRRRWGRTVTPHIGLGRPLKNRRVVAVVAPDCATADALTKIAMADPPLAARMLRERGGFVLGPAASEAHAA